MTTNLTCLLTTLSSLQFCDGLASPVDSLYHSFRDYLEVFIFTEANNSYYGKIFYGFQSKTNSAPVSVHKFSSLTGFENQFSIFCSLNNHAIVIQPSNTSQFFSSIEEICKLTSKCSNYLPQWKRSWRPYIFFIWPNTISSYTDFESEIVQTYKLIRVKTGGSFLLNSEVYVLTNSHHNGESSAVLYELYSIQNITIFRRIQGAATFQAIQRTVRRRKDFQGVKLRTLGWQRKGYGAALDFKEVNGELIMSSGYNIGYFNAMGQSLNMSSTGVRTKSFGVITKLTNGSVGGSGAQLLNDEADVSVSHSEYILYRAVQLSFLHPHYVTKIKAFFKQPPPTSVRDIYVGSIKTDLRIAMVCAWIFVIISLAIISMVQKRCFGETDTTHDGSLVNAILWGFTAFCQQGSHIQPSSISMKIGVIVVLFFSLVIYIGFSASVVSQLSVPVIPIKSFDDLLKSDLTIYNDNMTQAAKEYVDNAVAQGVIKPMKNPGNRTLPSYQSFHEIAENGGAYLSIEDEFYLTAAYFCNMSIEFLCKTISEVSVDAIGFGSLSGMTVRKGSPYTEYLKYAQLEMREYGVHHRLHENYRTLTKPRCRRMNVETPELRLNDTITAFTIWAVVFVTSAIILCFEIHVHRMRNQKSLGSETTNTKPVVLKNALQDYGIHQPFFVFCTRNGHPNPPSNEFCEICKEFLWNGIRCGNCQCVVNESWSFCFQCGFRLN